MINIHRASDIGTPPSQGGGPFRGQALPPGDANLSLFADTLAWAVCHGIPLEEALATLVRPVTTGPTHVLSAVPRSRAKRFAGDLQRLLRVLRAGIPLADALEQTMSSLLPGFFIRGVARAQRDNRLAEVLPLLADQITRRSRVGTIVRHVGAHVAVQAVGAFMTLLFVVGRVAPHIAEIMQEISGRPGKDTRFALATSVFEAIVAISLLTAVLGLALIKGRRRLWCERWVILKLPVIGRHYRRKVVADAARELTVLLREGQDLVPAVGCVANTTPSAWLQREMVRFGRRLHGGEHWAVAWESLDAADDFSRWAVRNAAQREDPAAGFEILADHYQDELDTCMARTSALVGPLSLLVLAIPVALLIYAVFAALIDLIHVLL